MRATESLSSDHRLIERVIGALQMGAARFDDGAPIPAGFFVDAARFIREFADGCHHRKEESVLFPAMGRHGFPADNGPVAVMLYEHELGREFAAGLRAAADRYASGDDSARRAIVDNALGYTSLLRGHIEKEDGILFRMADRAIPADEHDAIMAAFDALDREQPNPNPRDAYEALAARLEAALGIAAPA